MFSQISDIFFINEMQGSKVYTWTASHQLVTKVNQGENEWLGWLPAESEP